MKKNELIKKYRKEAKLTQEEVAKQLFMTRNAYCQYETGAIKIESDMFFRICEVLGVEWTHCRPSEHSKIRKMLEEYLKNKLQEKIHNGQIEIPKTCIGRTIDKLDWFFGEEMDATLVKKELEDVRFYIWDNPDSCDEFEFCLEVKNHHLAFAFTQYGEKIKDRWLSEHFPTKEDQAYRMITDRLVTYYINECESISETKGSDYMESVWRRVIYSIFPEYRPKEKDVDIKKMEKEAMEKIAEMIQTKKDAIVVRVICFTDETEGMKRFLSYGGKIISKGTVTNTEEIYYSIEMKRMAFHEFCKKEKRMIANMLEKRNEKYESRSKMVCDLLGEVHIPYMYQETEIF